MNWSFSAVQSSVELVKKLQKRKLDYEINEDMTPGKRRRVADDKVKKVEHLNGVNYYLNWYPPIPS